MTARRVCLATVPSPEGADCITEEGRGGDIIKRTDRPTGHCLYCGAIPRSYVFEHNCFISEQGEEGGRDMAKTGSEKGKHLTWNSKSQKGTSELLPRERRDLMDFWSCP